MNPLPDPRAARGATRLVFLVNGMVFAGWAPLVPLAKERLALDEAGLGLVLLALGAGAILAMPWAGPLIQRRGSRAVTLVAGCGFLAVLPLLALAPSAPLLGLALFLFGAAGGMMDVAMNAQAVAVEARGGRRILSSIHGLWSIGGLVGAGLSALLLGFGLAAPWVAGVLSALALAGLALAAPALLPRAGDRPAEGPEEVRGFALPRGPVLALGLLCCAAALAEGAMVDWTGVFLAEARGMAVELAGLGFAAFAVAMAAARLAGDGLASRFGPVAMIRAGTLLAALGLGLAVALPSGEAALAGFALAGLGLGNAVPLLFSAAGRLPGVAPGAAIAAVATLGYAGQLAGPALIGFLARWSSLPLALGGVALLMLAVAAGAGIARGR
ncbi:MFS transporter [Roseomonas sp. GC11]|uniref:MFS transporter n=1 Tax=Roseomonas sp. GC11 TaxID=2950546 RepID=UPI00210A89B9|nr:MFS transporter [Roseomonas sp. GC11]MCQ4161322.1 MFS transporter [Roseomonas sp. GC11]